MIREAIRRRTGNPTHRSRPTRELARGQTRKANPNTVYLSCQDGDPVAWRPGRLGPVAVFGAFDVPAAHLALDASGVRSQTPFGLWLGEDLGERLLMGGGEALGGETLGGSGCYGGRRAGRG